MILPTKILCLGAGILTMVIPWNFGCAQGLPWFTRSVTFDHSPIPPGSDIGVTYYFEKSMTFTPINPGQQFGRAIGSVEGGE